MMPTWSSPSPGGTSLTDLHKARSVDAPLMAVPSGARQGFGSVCLLSIGFTFFTGSVLVGGELARAFRFWPDLVLIIAAGNLLLAGYVSGLGFIAARTGFHTFLMTRFAFGEVGSRLSDLPLDHTCRRKVAHSARSFRPILAQRS